MAEAETSTCQTDCKLADVDSSSCQTESAKVKTSSWQTRLATVRERVEYAFKNSHFSDVEFTVDDGDGNKVTLSASKHILSISSPVFEAMFHGKLAETASTIDLPDCTKDGLQEMLRFLHSDVINLTGNNVMELLYLADKYDLPFLEKKCYEYIANDLTPTDVFTVLSQATQSGNSRVEELCWDIVDLKTHQAVTSKAFLNISRDLLQKVLERETLQTDEINLFKAVNAWASNRIQDESKKEDGEAKRAELGDEIIRLIRFPIMTQKEVAESVLVGNMLHPCEVTEVVQVFSSLAPAQSFFKCVKRKGQWCERWTKNRYDAVDSQHNEGKHYHSIMFKVNKPIFLAGLGLFAMANEAKNVVAKLSLYKSKKGSETQLFQKDVHMELKQNIGGSFFGHSVMINPPALLFSEELYVIKLVTIKEAPSGFGTHSVAAMDNVNFYLGSGGKSVVECGDIKITFIDSEESNSGTTVEYGQFPSMLLKRKVLLTGNATPNIFDSVPSSRSTNTNADTSQSLPKPSAARQFAGPDNPPTESSGGFSFATQSHFSVPTNGFSFRSPQQRKAK